MKQFILLTTIILSVQLIQAQSHVTYTYDDAGNRLTRQTLILKSPDKDDNNKDKNNDDYKTNEINNIFGEGNIVIAPNPTAGALYISFNNIELAENTVISLYDISGRTVLRQKVKSNREKLDLTNNPAGTYILIIVSGNDKIEYSVIKE